MAEIRMTEDAQRVLREAERICYQTNVAIGAPEHLLAAAIAVLTAEGMAGLPDGPQLEQAIIAVHGAGEQPLNTQVMWGSAAREAINVTARTVAEARQTDISARVLALGLIDSGEVNPMFYMSVGCGKEALRAALASV